MTNAASIGSRKRSAWDRSRRAEKKVTPRATEQTPNKRTRSGIVLKNEIVQTITSSMPNLFTSHETKAS
jgi:hypothetical protein